MTQVSERKPIGGSGILSYDYDESIICSDSETNILEIDNRASNLLNIDIKNNDSSTANASGTVTLDTGGSGSVTGITVDSIQVMSGTETFDTSLEITATNIAANITAFTSSPNYTAVAVGTVITITAVTAGTGPNGFVVVSSPVTITTTDVNLSGGDDPDEFDYVIYTSNKYSKNKPATGDSFWNVTGEHWHTEVASTTVTALARTQQQIAERWAWVVVTAVNTLAGNNATAKMWAFGSNN